LGPERNLNILAGIGGEADISISTKVRGHLKKSNQFSTLFFYHIHVGFAVTFILFAGARPACNSCTMNFIGIMTARDLVEAYAR
jgi:hypothetical protein